jgi:hypothetical protein
MSAIGKGGMLFAALKGRSFSVAPAVGSFTDTKALTHAFLWTPGDPVEKEPLRLSDAGQ